MSNGRADVAPVRDVFLRSGLSASEVCARLGWLRHGKLHTRGHRTDRQADTARLKRALGILPNCNMRRGRYYSKHAETIRRDIALAIVQACGYDAVDAGL